MSNYIINWVDWLDLTGRASECNNLSLSWQFHLGYAWCFSTSNSTTHKRFTLRFLDDKYIINIHSYFYMCICREFGLQHTIPSVDDSDLCAVCLERSCSVDAEGAYIVTPLLRCNWVTLFTISWDGCTLSIYLRSLVQKKYISDLLFGCLALCSYLFS
jgi:hypothetical protein